MLSDNDLLSYINKTPEIISLLYDMGMMPEQLKRDSHDWHRMLILASWHRDNAEKFGGTQPKMYFGAVDAVYHADGSDSPVSS